MALGPRTPSTAVAAGCTTTSTPRSVAAPAVTAASSRRVAGACTVTHAGSARSSGTAAGGAAAPAVPAVARTSDMARAARILPYGMGPLGGKAAAHGALAWDVQHSA